MLISKFSLVRLVRSGLDATTRHKMLATIVVAMLVLLLLPLRLLLRLLPITFVNDMATTTTLMVTIMILMLVTMATKEGGVSTTACRHCLTMATLPEGTLCQKAR